MTKVKAYTRSRIAVRIVIGALVAWWLIGQLVDRPPEFTIIGIVAIAVGAAALNRWVS